MPPDGRKVDVHLEVGDRNSAPAHGATPRELATAARARDVSTSLNPSPFRTNKNCGESLTRRRGHEYNI
jgi:hypothetical protein